MSQPLFDDHLHSLGLQLSAVFALFFHRFLFAQLPHATVCTKLRIGQLGKCLRRCCSRERTSGLLKGESLLDESCANGYHAALIRVRSKCGR